MRIFFYRRFQLPQCGSSIVIGHVAIFENLIVFKILCEFGGPSVTDIRRFNYEMAYLSHTIAGRLIRAQVYNCQVYSITLTNVVPKLNPNGVKRH